MKTASSRRNLSVDDLGRALEVATPGRGLVGETLGRGRGPGRGPDGDMIRDRALAPTTATNGDDATIRDRAHARTTDTTAETVAVGATHRLLGGTIAHVLAPTTATTEVAGGTATTTAATALAHAHRLGSVRTHAPDPAHRRGAVLPLPNASASVRALCLQPPSTRPTCTHSLRRTASPMMTDQSRACGRSRALPSARVTYWRWTRRELRRTSARSESTRCVLRRVSARRRDSTCRCCTTRRTTAIG